MRAWWADWGPSVRKASRFTLRHPWQAFGIAIWGMALLAFLEHNFGAPEGAERANRIFGRWVDAVVLMLLVALALAILYVLAFFWHTAAEHLRVAWL